MCLGAGVKLRYLPSYSPDLKLIEDVLSELKRFVKRKWNGYGINVNHQVNQLQIQLIPSC